MKFTRSQTIISSWSLIAYLQLQVWPLQYILQYHAFRNTYMLDATPTLTLPTHKVKKSFKWSILNCTAHHSLSESITAFASQLITADQISLQNTYTTVFLNCANLVFCLLISADTTWRFKILKLNVWFVDDLPDRWINTDPEPEDCHPFVFSNLRFARLTLTAFENWFCAYLT